MKTLFSLIIAIDNYPIPTHRLNGCVNDASAFATYLESYSQAHGLEYKPLHLFDDKATRQGVVDGFKHLHQAKEGDICVLYYSGHGSQMAAAPEFWDEQDGRSETIVCYDSRLAGGRDLLDKELSTLLWQVTNNKNLHCLVVMDCCHSGSNTRDLDIKARMAEPSSFVPKDVSGFYGVDNWVNFQPPSSRHIHLAAAKDSETAKELKIEGTPRGAFTYNLIKTLNQVGTNISYNELVAQIGQRVRNLVKEQTPQCDAYKVPSDIDLTFLGSTIKKGEFLVSCDKNEGWIVNVGGVQGIPTSGATLTLDDGRSVSITEVKSNFSKIDGMADSPTDAHFKAVLTKIDERNLALPLLRIAFSKDSEPEGINVLKALFNKNPSEILQLSADEKDTDYVVRAWEGAYRLTQVNDSVPVFKRVDGYNENTAQLFLNNIETVARWKGKLILDNPLTTIQDSEFEIIIQDEKGNPLTPPYVFQQPNEKKEVVGRFGVKNIGARTYWVSGVYMGADFGATNEFLPKKEIKKGETAWVEYENNKDIPLMVQEAFISWGVNEVTEYFKFFISTDPIDTNIHNQEPLQLDIRKAATRAIQRASPTIPTTDWRTILVPFTTVVPLNKQPLKSGATTQLQNTTLTIQAPAGFSAQLTVSSTQQATRDVASSVPILRGGENMRSMPLTEGKNDSPELDILELYDVKGSVSTENPLKISFEQVNDLETIVPFGFDSESGLFIPIGAMYENGVVEVSQLPLPEASEAQRGIADILGTPLKIYFKKLISPIFGNYDYPMLRMAIFTDESDSFEYEADIEIIKKAVADAKSVVLFVHGLVGTSGDHPKAIRRAAGLDGYNPNQYEVVLTYDYETLNTKIEETGTLLEERLQSIGITEGCGKTFEIIAHSMGCLVSRYFVEKLSGKKTVTRLMLFGAPNSGSELSDLRGMVTNLLTIAVNGAVFLKPYILPLSILGKFLNKMMVTIDELNPKSDFITDLNSQPDTGIHYILTAGNTNLIKKEESPHEFAFYQKVFHSLQKNGIYAAADWWFHDNNDLAVKVQSVFSVGNQKNIQKVEIPCDHFCFFVPQSAGIQAFAKVVMGIV